MEGITQVLKFKREGEYSNTGEHFRVFEFTTDCPEIPAGRVEASPAHAVAGDELWAEDDEMEPYRLKREGKTVGNPENWLVGPYIPPTDRAGVEITSVAPPTGFLQPVDFSFYTGNTKRDARAYQVLTGGRLEYPGGTILFEWKHTGYAKLPDEKDLREFRDYGLRQWVKASEVVSVVDWRAAVARAGERSSWDSVAVAVETISGTPIGAGDTIIVRPPNTEDPRPVGAQSHCLSPITTRFESTSTTHLTGSHWWTWRAASIARWGHSSGTRSDGGCGAGNGRRRCTW